VALRGAHSIVSPQSEKSFCHTEARDTVIEKKTTIADETKIYFNIFIFFVEIMAAAAMLNEIAGAYMYLSAIAAPNGMMFETGSNETTKKIIENAMTLCFFLKAKDIDTKTMSPATDKNA